MLILAVYSYRDIREKTIPARWLAAGMAVAAVLGIGRALHQADGYLWSSILGCLCGMLPGILLILLAMILKGRVGWGDGLVLAVIGMMTGVEYALAILLAALVMSFVYSCFLLVVCRKEKNYCFPFVPFYLLGTAAVYLLTTG